MAKHFDGSNVAELRNFKLNPKATAPTSPVVGVPWTLPSGKIQYFDGTATQTIASLNDIAGFGRYRGVWDASTGIPTSTAIKAGDFWRISVAGNIVNLIGQDLLTPGDVIVADVDGANTAAQFFGIQANTSLTLATILEEVTLATLLANTATDAIPVSLAGGKIGHYMVLDSTGRDISAELDVIVVAANPKITISSLTALSNLKVVFVGTTAGGL